MEEGKPGEPKDSRPNKLQQEKIKVFLDEEIHGIPKAIRGDVKTILMDLPTLQ